MADQKQSLRDFITRNGKPYNPKDDHYERESFAADIKEGKNTPIYNAHSYHTKVPPRSIIPYILHYTAPGDIVLDPFCGSGMSGVACLMCENPPKELIDSVSGARRGARRAILNDLSPAACHIASNYCTSVDLKALKEEFEHIRTKVKDEFCRLYGTEHYEPAKDLYDPNEPRVASRLKKSPRGEVKRISHLFFDQQTNFSWELLNRSGVEERMGAEALKKQPLPEGVKQFICIPAITQYTIWSDVYKCEGMVSIPEPGKKSKKRVARGCGKEIVLWDVAIDHASGKVNNCFKCSHCGQEWRKTQIKRVTTLPVVTNYEYLGFKEKKRGKHIEIRDALIRAERPVTQKEREFVAEIETQTIPYWYPNDPIDKKREMYIRSALHLHEIETGANFYTKRNLWALARLWKECLEIENKTISNHLLFILTSCFGHLEKLTRYKFKKGGNSALTGTMYIGSITIEDMPLRVANSKVTQIIRGLSQIFKGEIENKVIVNTGSADTLDIPNDTIDYIFTDPPFGSNIFYADCSFLWESWLGKFTDDIKEAVWNKSRKPIEGGKSLEDYGQLMADSFKEMYRVLKPGRWATVIFNNSDGQVFEVIKKAARDAGFKIENMLFLDKVQKSFKQIKGAKGEADVVGQDVLFILRKSKYADEKKAENGENADLTNLIIEAVQNHLQTLPERIQTDPKTYSNEHRTTPFLNTMLVSTLIPRGKNVDSLNLPLIEKVCARYFRKIENKWYLKSELIGNQHGENGTFIREVEVKDEVSAIEWLREHLAKNPMMIGDLKPLWFRATAKLAGDLSTNLERILHQNFWLDRATNKWKEPTDEERSRMDSTERERAIHEAERYLSGHLNRSPSDKERCQWIGLVYEKATALEEELVALESAVDSPSSVIRPEDISQLYQLMTNLYQGILKEKVEDNLYQRASRQVRIASAKLSQISEDDEKSGQKNKKSSYQYKLF